MPGNVSHAVAASQRLDGSIASSCCTKAHRLGCEIGRVPFRHQLFANEKRVELAKVRSKWCIIVLLARGNRRRIDYDKSYPLAVWLLCSPYDSLIG